MRRALAALLWIAAVLLAVPAVVALADAAVWMMTDRTLTGVSYTPGTGRHELVIVFAGMSALAALAGWVALDRER